MRRKGSTLMFYIVYNILSIHKTIFYVYVLEKKDNKIRKFFFMDIRGGHYNGKYGLLDKQVR
jgi:hypothetical protein